MLFFHRIFATTALTCLCLVSSTLSAFAQTPNDPNYGQQWYLNQIQANQAWDTVTGGDVVIAVLDTGLDLDHEDMQGNIWTNSGETAGNSVDDDGNGYIDDVYGWDFVQNDNDPSPKGVRSEDHAAASHGTFVAGVIAAADNNAAGYAGVLWQAKIMPVRVLDRVGAGNENDVARAITYAVTNGADVINMSFAGTITNDNLEQAIETAYAAGVIVVAAMGNDSINTDVTPVYPACSAAGAVNMVIGVAATDEQDRQTDFTNYGASCVDIAAPGVSFYNLAYLNPAGGYNKEYEGPWEGTSFAAPVVAGVAALLKLQYPSLTPEQIILALKLSVDPAIATTGTGAIGVGRVNAAKALTMAQAYATTTSATNTSLASFIALAAPAGQAPLVEVVKIDGTPYASFPAYGSNFHGGVDVAMDDFDGDGLPEVVTGAGPSGGPHVRVFKPYGALIGEFFAYDAQSSQGVSIATGDVNGDGQKEIITAVGGGVSNDIVIWSKDGVEQSRFTVGGFGEEVRFDLTVTNVDADIASEIIISPESGEPRIVIYKSSGSKLVEFLVDEGSMTAGVQVAAGDLDRDGRSEIVAVSEDEDSTLARFFSVIGSLAAEVRTEDVKSTGTSIAAYDTNDDGISEVLLTTAAGPAELLIIDPISGSIIRLDTTTQSGANIAVY